MKKALFSGIAAFILFSNLAIADTVGPIKCPESNTVSYSNGAWRVNSNDWRLKSYSGTSEYPVTFTEATANSALGQGSCYYSGNNKVSVELVNTQKGRIIPHNSPDSGSAWKQGQVNYWDCLSMDQKKCTFDPVK